MLQRFGDVKAERDDLKSNLQSSIYDVKQKASFRTVLLEKKLKSVQSVVEGHEAQLNEILRRSNLDPTEIGQISLEITDTLQLKNNEARRLQSEVNRLQTLQVELNAKVINKLKDYGLYVEELGFILPRPPVEIN